MSALYDDYPVYSPGTFRVLLPERRAPHGQPSYQFCVRRLDAAGCYFALSYVWGAPERSEVILVNQQPFHITKNLLDALESIEKHHSDEKTAESVEVAIWADQLCINQANLLERGLQVALMAQIYSTATRVYVRLGRSSTASDVSRILGYLGPRIDRDMEQYGAFHRMPHITNDEIKEYDLLNWAAVREMTQCVWFQRVWVIQEVGLAKDALVLYGDCHFEWKLFMRLLGWLASPGSRIYQRHKLSGWTARQLWQSFDVGNRNTAEDYQPFSCLDLLSNAAHRCNATDPRDYIYGLLGHPLLQASGTGVAAHVKPDYVLPPERLFYQFAAACLGLTSKPFILSCVNHRWLPSPRGVSSVQPLDGNTPDIPSWSPKWDYMPLGGTRWMVESRSGWDASMTKGFSFSIKGETLNVLGHPFDIVSESFPSLDELDIPYLEHNSRYQHSSPFSIEEIEIITKLGNLCDRILEKSARSARSIVTAFATTIIAGLWSSDDAPRCEAVRLVMLKEALSKAYLFHSWGQKDVDTAPTWFMALDRLMSSCENLTCDAAWTPPELIRNIRSAMLNMQSRRLFLSKSGYVGLAADIVSPGDICCIVAGASIPFILRPCKRRLNSYLLVGESYIHGVMHGQEAAAQRDLQDGWTELSIV